MDTEQILDACLEKALMLHDLNYPTTVVLGKGGNSIERGEPGYFPNVNIQGMSGCGKTCIIKKWAKNNEINLVTLYVPIFAAYEREKQKDAIAQCLRSEEIKEDFLKPRTVFVLDHYEYITHEIKEALVELIDAHVLPSGDEKVFMPELLFTIAVETTGRRKSFEEK